MNQPIISISIDAMGGDRSPNKVIEGSKIFLNDNKNVKLIIFGNKNLISHHFSEKYSELVSIIHCDETISDNDKPSSIL